MADPAQLHADQVDYWNGAGGARWIANEIRRDRLLSPFAHAALARAAPQPGEFVIDIGCGCGETTVELAKRVGSSGRVLAVDVSAPILAVARERLQAFPNTEAVVADAANYAFAPEAADLLFSRFGVMFFGDPAGAFANLRKALKPGGRLVFACWRSGAENAWMTAPLEAVFQHVSRPPKPDPHDPGPLAFADQAWVTEILTKAGFATPRFERFDCPLDVAITEGVEGALATALEFGPSSALVADVSPEVKARVADSLRTLFAPMDRNGSIELPAAVWLVSASLKAEAPQ